MTLLSSTPQAVGPGRIAGEIDRRADLLLIFSIVAFYLALETAKRMRDTRQGHNINCS